MEFVAGIDGGGTKTSLICRSLSGADLCRIHLGSFNINSIGEAAFSGLMQEISDLLQETSTCVSLCIGGAGISNPRVQEILSKTLSWVPLCKMVGDHDIALWGALGNAPGCVIISGTGSICLGRNSAGDTARAGGWGHLIGDFGSGYSLGRDAMVAVAKAKDGCAPQTLLTQLLAEELGLNSRQDIISYVYGGDKTRLSSLVPLVERAALAGDAVAEEILRRNASELTALCTAVCNDLQLCKAEVAIMGGLLEHGTTLRRYFVEEMKRKLPDIACIAARNSAAEGAVLLAERLHRDRERLDSQNLL